MATSNTTHGRDHRGVPNTGSLGISDVNKATQVHYFGSANTRVAGSKDYNQSNSSLSSLRDYYMLYSVHPGSSNSSAENKISGDFANARFRGINMNYVYEATKTGKDADGNDVGPYADDLDIGAVTTLQQDVPWEAKYGTKRPVKMSDFRDYNFPGLMFRAQCRTASTYHNTQDGVIVVRGNGGGGNYTVTIAGTTRVTQSEGNPTGSGVTGAAGFATSYWWTQLGNTESSWAGWSAQRVHVSWTTAGGATGYIRTFLIGMGYAGQGCTFHGNAGWMYGGEPGSYGGGGNYSTFMSKYCVSSSRGGISTNRLTGGYDANNARAAVFTNGGYWGAYLTQPAGAVEHFMDWVYLEETNYTIRTAADDGGQIVIIGGATTVARATGAEAGGPIDLRMQCGGLNSYTDHTFDILFEGWYQVVAIAVEAPGGTPMAVAGALWKTSDGTPSFSGGATDGTDDGLVWSTKSGVRYGDGSTYFRWNSGTESSPAYTTTGTTLLSERLWWFPGKGYLFEFEDNIADNPGVPGGGSVSVEFNDIEAGYSSEPVVLADGTQTITSSHIYSTSSTSTGTEYYYTLASLGNTNFPDSGINLISAHVNIADILVDLTGTFKAVGSWQMKVDSNYAGTEGACVVYDSSVTTSHYIYNNQQGQGARVLTYQVNPVFVGTMSYWKYKLNNGTESGTELASGASSGTITAGTGETDTITINVYDANDTLIHSEDIIADLLRESV